MSNVLSEEKKQQVIALEKLGWPLRRIEQATGVRLEAAGTYLKAAGTPFDRPVPGGRAPANPANEVTPDFSLPISPSTGKQDRATSACEPYREWIDPGFRRGRNGKAIRQDLVSDHGFSGSYQRMKRFVRKLDGAARPEAVRIIETARSTPPSAASVCVRRGLLEVREFDATFALPTDD
jgi:hypothetical protein